MIPSVALCSALSYQCKANIVVGHGTVVSAEVAELLNIDIAEGGHTRTSKAGAAAAGTPVVAWSGRAVVMLSSSG